jgi:CheY-like chemotaxis protein/HPt (histidine-containing phosphotransfer) domain-containing protein
MVDVAEGGEQALALLRAGDADGRAYQAVFVDWQMPGLDGWATSGRIRELGLGGDAPVIVMVTAHGREELSRRSEAEQGLLDGFLVKPVTASMLFDAATDARCGRVHPLERRQRTAGEPRLAGMRLLVVEDNPNNQQVVRELLEDEGASVRIANHGQEAVEALSHAEQPFDIVLMDLQMPVMDGFTATSRIRMDLGMQSLPIVAMTANAMASDREACLAAGMNDHVGKPFDLDELVRLLRRLAGWQPAAEHAVPANVRPLPPTVGDAASRAGVDVVGALNRLGGHHEVYQRMLRTFVGDLAAMPAQLRALAAQNEVVPASRLVHTLRGLAATLGATALASEAALAEKQLTAVSAAAEASAIVARVCDAIAAAGHGLSGLLQALQEAQAPQPDVPPVLDIQALLTALRAMATHLENADMSATDAMSQLQRQFGGSLGGQLHSLDEAIGMLDFERALRLCNELIETQAG